MPDDKGRGLPHKALIIDNSVLSRIKLFLVLVLVKATIESTLHLNLSGEATVLYMGDPYPCHQDIKMCNKHNRKKTLIC